MCIANTSETPDADNWYVQPNQWSNYQQQRIEKHVVDTSIIGGTPGNRTTIGIKTTGFIVFKLKVIDEHQTSLKIHC